MTARSRTRSYAATQARSRPTSSTRRGPSGTQLSDGQRAYDLAIAQENLTGELFDLARDDAVDLAEDVGLDKAIASYADSLRALPDERCAIAGDFS